MGTGEILTLAAILVAMFWQPILNWWIAPVLKVQFGPVDNQMIPVSGKKTDDGDDSKRQYFHLKIENTGRSTARRVHVYAGRLWKWRRDQWDEVRDFLPMCLVWTNLIPAKHEIDLSPKMGWTVDLGHVPCDAYAMDSPVDLTAHPRAPFCLCMQTATSSKSNELPEGDYQLQLFVASDNAAPMTIYARVEHHVLLISGRSNVSGSTASAHETFQTARNRS